VKNLEYVKHKAMDYVLFYSLYLKQKAIIDVMTLAGLYTVRVVAGAVAIDVYVSEWLLTFSIFLFLCLGLVKRLAELNGCLQMGKDAPQGRGYQVSDLSLLQSLAAASGYAAVVVLALYINSPIVVEQYRYPQALWMLCALMLYWITRVLLITHRGKMPDDPVVFAIKDPVSLGIVVLGATIVLGSMK